MRSFIFVLLAVGMSSVHAAAPFSLHEKEGAEPGATLLVVGGIQGDEPGGFMAASLLLTHYTITRGRLRVVPNLNLESIVARNRGLYGDLNRKFASLRGNDPEHATVDRIKALITAPEVSGVLNLHDGSGFYRERHIDARRSPLRWGQSAIIDQAQLEGADFGNLEVIARRVADHVNVHLLDDEHRFGVKNTRTRWGDEEMAKTLTFFAVEQNKPAFGVEASKELNTAQRAYYHLRAVEGFMHAFNIGFERDFELSPAGVTAAINAHPRLALYDNRVVFDVADPRPSIGYVPLKKEAPIEFQTTSPVVALLRAGGGYQVCYGNRRLTLLRPEFREFDESLNGITLTVDGDVTQLPWGATVSVSEGFQVEPLEGYRVNLIGVSRKGIADEAGIYATRADFQDRFSIDRGGNVYRVEVYRGDRFSGMVLVDFSRNPRPAPTLWFAGTTLPENPGPGPKYDAKNLGR